MKLSSSSFDDRRAIPAEFALARMDSKNHVALSKNRNPHLAWRDVPKGTRSFALLCVDPDAPSVGDDVNKEGRVVREELARTDFVHWVMIDIPATCTEIAAGACSQSVTPRGKRAPNGPVGARQGRNDYTSWFADDPQMAGTYLGYDGPGPPWNDERLHRYRFEIVALGVAKLVVPEEFGLVEVKRAFGGHMLASASITGTYTLNPKLAP